jgi:hypothetical protein
MRIGDPSSRDHAPSSAGAFDSKVSSPPHRCCQCAEYSSRISDLENRLTLAKRQAQMTIDKASKSCGLMKRISILDDEVSSLMAKVLHHEECDSFVISIIESACEMLRCKILCDFSFFLSFHCCSVMCFVILGTCLDFAAEDRRVAERNVVLEKMSEGIDSLWSDPRRRCAIVLLQDRAQHIGESVDGCRRALITMHSIMLPRNPLPGIFPLLLDAFRSSQRIHQLIELNLVAGANFALGWMRKCHPRLNYSSMLLSYPSSGASLRVHLENTMHPARRIIARLLQEDATFFREYHYLDPLGVDDSDNPML